MKTLTNEELARLKQIGATAAKNHPETGDLIARAVAELAHLRERESATRFLIGLEGDY